MKLPERRSGCRVRLLWRADGRAVRLPAGSLVPELRSIGFHLGKFIYLLDAYDDLEHDQRKGPTIR